MSTPSIRRSAQALPPRPSLRPRAKPSRTGSPLLCFLRRTERSKMVVGKKGIELSMNFVVMLIIAIVIFGFGIRFIYTLSSNANDIKDISSKELDARVADLLCSTSQKICIGTDKKIIQKGKFDIFGIRILNVGDAQDFDILIQRPSPSGFTKQKQAISNDGLLAVPNERSE